MNNFDYFKYQSSENQNTNTSNGCYRSKFYPDNIWEVDPFFRSEHFLGPNFSRNILDLSKPALDDDETSSRSSLNEDFQPKPKVKRQKMLRKLPMQFFDKKDWAMYVKFASNQANRCTNQRFSRFKSNKPRRLLMAFFTLYQHYNDLYDDYEALHANINESYTNLLADNSSLASDYHSVKSGDSKRSQPNLSSSNNQTNSDDRLRSNQLINSSVQTNPIPEWSELDDDQLTNLHVNNDISDPKNWQMMPNDTLHKRLNTEDNSIKKRSKYLNDSSGNKKYKIYDRLNRQNFVGNQEIHIIEELNHSAPRITHRMNLMSVTRNSFDPNHSSEDCSQTEALNPVFSISTITNAFKFNRHKHTKLNNSSNLSLVNIPILMEVLLPKVQQKMKYILEKCPFLSNPLEIVAELKCFNYNKHNTIEYFRKTKQLRDSLKEFLKPTTDSNIKSMILQSLYHGDIHNIQNTKDNLYDWTNSMYACTKCGRDINSKDNIIDNSIPSIAERDKWMHDTSSSLSIYRSMDTIATTNTCLIKKPETNSKYTSIEMSYFDNAVQDSCMQTLPIEDSRSKTDVTEVIKRCGQVTTKNLGNIRNNINDSKDDLSQFKTQFYILLKTMRGSLELMVKLSGKQNMSDQYKGQLLVMSRQVDELKIKLKNEETKRRNAYNLMQELVGNVRVYCRCRDVAKNENVLEIHDSESIVSPLSSREKFTFDKVFSTSKSQNDIYDEFQPLVMSFIDGFNVCFITYGSEASGKTYTLIGGNSDLDHEKGIMHRALSTLLTEKRTRTRDWEYQIGACLLEIYNDSYIDLLSGEQGVQMYVDCGMETVYQRLKNIPITNESDVQVLIQLCRAKRKIARTALNPASSRSHLITLIRLQGQSKVHGESIRSYMCLCDLAGFEDIIKAETQSNKTLSKEAGYINRSLTAFNRVFVSLRRQDPNTVCYRETKLTHMLKPFLTNSGKCALIITVRTDQRSIGSTQNTLRFGRETRGVTLGKVRRQKFITQSGAARNSN